MKETQFIDQNKDKWREFEKKLLSSSSDPEEIRELYTELNNDLSFAQTFYEKRMVRSYLNDLAQNIHRRLYKQKREPLTSIIKTWTIELPLEIYNARKNLLFALVLFLIYVTIGAFSVHQDIGYATKILGFSYIELTENNIAAGNPLGIYGTSSQGTMFLEITINNIMVALICFIGGILFSLGTHVVLFNNAIMVGVFQYFFKLKGLLLTSFLTIWIHGAFEISAIVIASGAGFTLGHGLLFPGSYTRLQSLQINGMRGVRIMLSLVPIFVMAGFLESYVTRHYQHLPDWSKWLIILFSFSFILFYYIIYPILVARKYPERTKAKPQVNVFEKVDFVPYKERKNIEVFRESFQIYFTMFSTFWSKIVRFVLPIILGIMIFQNIVHYDDLKSIYKFDWQAQLSILFGAPRAQTFNGLSDIIVSIVWIIPLSLIALSAFYVFFILENKTSISFKSYVKKRFLKMTVGIAMVYSLFLILPYFLLITSVFFLPFLMLIPTSIGLNEPPTILTAFKLASKKWVGTFSIFSLLCLTVFFIAQPIAFVLSIHDGFGQPIMNDLLDWLTDFLLPIFAEISEDPIVWANIVRQVIYILFFVLILPIFFFAFGLLFYTAKEEEEAIGLFQELERFGKRSKTKENTFDFDK